MEKTLATLAVVLSDDREGLSSNLSFPKDGTQDYTLTIKPYVDKDVLAMAHEPLNSENMQTILAHELGHFIGNVLHDKTHDRRNLRLQELTNDSRYVLPAEQKAWSLAEIINPKLNKHIERFALEGYETNGANGAKTENY